MFLETTSDLPAVSNLSGTSDSVHSHRNVNLASRRYQYRTEELPACGRPTCEPALQSGCFSTVLDLFDDSDGLTCFKICPLSRPAGVCSNFAQSWEPLYSGRRRTP